MIKHTHPYNRTMIAESRAEVPAALAWLIASQVDDTRTANAAGIRLLVRRGLPRTLTAI